MPARSSKTSLLWRSWSALVVAGALVFGCAVEAPRANAQAIDFPARPKPVPRKVQRAGSGKAKVHAADRSVPSGKGAAAGARPVNTSGVSQSS